jgi:hypothetical protein
MYASSFFVISISTMGHPTLATIKTLSHTAKEDVISSWKA